MNANRTRRDFLKHTSKAAAAVGLAPVFAPLRSLAARGPVKITAVEPYVLRGNRCFVLV